MRQSAPYKLATAILAIVCVSAAQAATHAGTFQWGDFYGPEVMFLDVTENNDQATALFAPMPGMGGPMIVGNSLHLAPQGFASMSSNNSADLLDSTLSTIIMAAPGESISDVTINEFGDYSLGGLSGSNASAQVGAAFFWTVLEVDNAAVSLNTQATNLILGSGSGPNGGVYTRPANDGTAVIWNGSAQLDLASYLTSQNITGEVTKLQLTFDNTLQTSAEAGSTAFIKKKSVNITVNPQMPEPTTIVLMGMGLAATVCVRKRG